MIGKFIRLFRFYRQRHRRVHFHPRELTSPTARLGWLDRAWLQDGALRVEGWTCAQGVALRTGGQVVPLTNRPERADVPLAYGARGFRGSAPDRGALALRLELPDGLTDIPLGRPGWRQRLKAETRLLHGFLRDGRRALPHALAWLRTHAPAERLRTRAALRLDDEAAPRLIDPRVLATAEPGPVVEGVTVIVPVHGARLLTQEALTRLAANTEIAWRAIVIDDASPDPLVWPMLCDWAQAQGERVRLLKNDGNLGFPATVNRALAEAQGLPGDWPVVLLNTDAMVPPGWASRLLEPLADPRVASVTPLSNDAEICTVPMPGDPQPLFPGAADVIDRRAAMLGGQTVEVPTGVGFCMALAPQWLARVPGFDPVFGRGYGEEVDWCQHTRALGARHVVQHRLFVEHRSGASFGADLRASRVAEAGRIVSARYPKFDTEVQDFLAEDPLATARMALAVAQVAAAAREVPVFLAHSLGGGADLVLRRRLEGDSPSVVLRVGGPLRWRLELHAGGRQLVLWTDKADEIRDVLAPLRKRVIYSCGVGDPDAMTLPGHLLRLADGGPIEVDIHDYFILSPSVFLLDSDKRYRGVPAPDSPDPADHARRPDGRIASLREWRGAWGQLVEHAETIRVFSRDSARLVAEVYPSATAKTLVEPHRLLATPSLLRAPRTSRQNVGVLGNIGLPKGAGLLCDLARFAARRGEIQFTLFGSLDPAFPPPARLRVLGGYRLSEIVPLAQKHGVGTWLIPSICPETFSFATHEALATGLPVVGLAIGAQGEALRASPQGIAVPLVEGRAVVEDLYAAFQSVFDARVSDVNQVA